MREAGNSGMTNGRQSNGHRELDTSSPSTLIHLKFSIAVLAIFGMIGCTLFTSGRDLPPLLTQDEIVRPYTKLAVVEVNRQRYGTSYELKTEDYNWAHDALREEAAKIGADAVILPEVKIDASSYLLFPTAQVDARGIAIRFR